MWEPLPLGIQHWALQRKMVYDKFPPVQHANTVIDELYRQGPKKQPHQRQEVAASESAGKT